MAGILFSHFKNNEPKFYDKEVVLEYFSPATSFVVEHYLENSPAYEEAIVDCMRGVFIAVKENRVEIAVESFVDCVKALIKWFKKWFMKFVSFVKENFKKLDLYFLKGKVVIDRFLKTTPRFEPFILSGYKYTIPDGHLNSGLLFNYMDMVEEEILQILRADSTSLNPRIAKAQEKLGSAKLMNHFRGILLSRPAVNASTFKHELKYYFRNNSLKADIQCNVQTVTGFCEEYKLLAKQIDSIKKNRMSIEIHTNRILDFLEHEPEKYYDGYSNGSDLDRRKNMGIAIVYSSANAIIKQLNLMYDFYFSAKLDAINEAMQFYVKAASKALASSSLGMVKFAKEDCVPDVDIYKDPITESSFFFSDSNYEHNFDKWKSGEIKVLLILGLAGSGKSTLANQLAKEYNCHKVELDFYGKIVKKEYPEIKDWENGDRARFVVNHAIEHYQNQRVIIEGGQIAFCNPATLAHHAIIVTCTSFMTSNFRASKRAFTDTDREAKFAGTTNPVMLFLHALFRSTPKLIGANVRHYRMNNEFQAGLMNYG